MSRFRRRLMGLSAMRKAVADDYVRVEYIENTSKAYINTLYKLNYNSKIEAQFSVSEFSDVNSQYLFGARTSNTINKFYIMFPNNSQRMQWHYRAAEVQSNIDIQLDEKWTISNNQGTLTYSNGTDTYTLSNVSASFSTAYNCVIFCMNGRGSIPTVNCFKGRIYYFKIYQGNELVRDYIPVYKKSTKQYGLWDRVERRFYTSPNGTAFIGRQMIYDAEIEYLEKGSGTNSLINLGTNADAIFEITAQATTITNSSMTLINRHTASVGGSWFGVPVVTNRYWGLATTNGAYSNVSSLNKTNITVDFTVNPIVGTIDGDTFSRSKGSSNINWILFGSLNNSYPFIGRLYSLKAYIGGKLTFDLIPVRVGNVGYMYDKVSGKLFGNIGRDKFILGKDVSI